MCHISGLRNRASGCAPSADLVPELAPVSKEAFIYDNATLLRAKRCSPSIVCFSTSIYFDYQFANQSSRQSHTSKSDTPVPQSSAFPRADSAFYHYPTRLTRSTLRLPIDVLIHPTIYPFHLSHLNDGSTDLPTALAAHQVYQCYDCG